MFVPSYSTVPKLQTPEDLQGDTLLHYDAEIELKNLILLSWMLALRQRICGKELNDDIQTNYEDPLTSVMLLLARAITQNFSNPINNHLRTSSNTKNQAVIQGDRLNIQSRNFGNAGRNNKRAYIQEEVVEGSNETGNVQRTLRISCSGNTSTVQCYNCS
nr:hypothetical protein [Tanacetum cinerariifolium]